MTITNSTFLDNLAVNGGAIYIYWDYLKKWANEISSCTFDNNTATKNGGAIRYTSYRPSMTNNTFIGNSATYGPEVASFAVRIKEVVNGELVDIVAIDDIPSGQPIENPVTFAIVDEDDVIMVSDSANILNISFIKPGSLIQPNNISSRNWQLQSNWILRAH